MDNLWIPSITIYFLINVICKYKLFGKYSTVDYEY